jgi:protein-S-isoprenylcysteine O-methyltransferase Ste14
MREMSSMTKKAISVPFVLLYMNSVMILFAPEAYLNPLLLTPVLVLSAVICADVAVRPISAKRDQYRCSILVLAFLLFPLVVALPYLEYRYLLAIALTRELTLVLWVAGIGMLLVGSCVLIDSRHRIGRYGGPRIVIEDDHRLIRDGAYRYIRHPLYMSMLLMFIGYGRSFGSVLVTSVTFICMFMIMRSRMNLEERLLIESFGEEYLSYKEHTWRLFPHVY